MLLQALHKYATERKLLDRLPFQVRTVHLVIQLNTDGSPRGNGLVPQTTPVPKKSGKKETVEERPGLRWVLPRYPGEKNNTKAQYLADPLRVVLGLDKDTLAPLPDETPKRVPDAVQQFRMFWRWVEEAAARLAKAGHPDPRLKALLAFKEHHLGTVRGWVGEWTNPNARTPKPVPAARLAGGGWHPLADGDVVAFWVGDEPVRPTAGDDWKPLSLAIATDPLWADWRDEFRRAFDAEVGHDHLGVDQPSLCLVSGAVGERVAAIHKPEVKVRGTPPKGASFFSCGERAFQSYGLDGAANASVSIPAAAGYALSLEDLLAGDDTRFVVGGVTFCFWADSGRRDATARMGRMLNSASPAVVAEFVKSPFAGVERAVAKKDAFLSAALAANGGRIMVREWLRVPLDEAITNFEKWFADLEIAPLGDERADADAGPYALFRLAGALVRESGELDRMSDAVTTLYRAAWDRSAPPLRLLEPLLAEFRSALVTDTEKKPRYPFARSRFSLLKLVLTRHAKEGGFMPTVHLCETDDAAYNLGRLLCILAALQDAAHEYELEGPGVVERYYGTASAAPASVFGVLWKLHVHHLRKLEQSEKGAKAAYRIRNQLADVVAGFPPAGPNQPPRFPPTLTLEEQGRFALGFYQQMAADRQAVRDAKAKKTDPATTE